MSQFGGTTLIDGIFCRPLSAFLTPKPASCSSQAAPRRVPLFQEGSLTADPLSVPFRQGTIPLHRRFLFLSGNIYWNFSYLSRLDCLIIQLYLSSCRTVLIVPDPSRIQHPFGCLYSGSISVFVTIHIRWS